MNINVDNILKIESNGLSIIYETLNKNNIKGKFLLLTEKKLEELYGEDIKIQLRKLGELSIEYFVDNSIKCAMELATEIIENDIDYVVGLGGGRVLDVCKYASYIAKKQFISLPTTLANDGIASPIAVLKLENGKVKSLGCAMAKAIIIDTTLMTKCPIELIKAGIGDTISNYMALLDWEFACKKGKDKMNDFAYLMSRESLDALIQTEFKEINEQFIKVLANSIVLSGIAMQFTGNSRPVSGSEHLFSHALDYYCDVNNLHGLQVALGTVTMLKLLEFDYSEVIKYLKKFEVNINPRYLSITEKDFVLCMRNAVSMRSRYTYLNEISLNDEKLKKIYRELLEEL